MIAINSRKTTIGSILLLSISNSYADACDSVISSNLIEETIAISDTEKISIAPWPIVQLNTNCAYTSGWNIALNVALNEAGNDSIGEINETYFSNVNMLLSKGNYKIEVGRFKNNMSFNSVFGFALPMKTIPSIQLDEASYIQTVAPDVDLIRITRDTSFGSMYVGAYRAGKALDHRSNLRNSFNSGIAKPINDHTNVEMQYANESAQGVGTRQERLSLFFNISGSFDNQRKWGAAAEINRFKNRAFIQGNNDVAVNLYSEISQKNVFPSIDAYLSAGGSLDNKNQASIEAGVFFNISTLLKMTKNISIKAGAAQSHTIFQGGKNITTDRYSVQVRYEM